MSKSINLEVVTIEDGYVVLEAENGCQIEMSTLDLPDNLREGRCLKFVISHTDYNMNKEYEQEDSRKEKQILPNGRQLSY